MIAHADEAIKAAEEHKAAAQRQLAWIKAAKRSKQCTGASLETGSTSVAAAADTEVDAANTEVERLKNLMSGRTGMMMGTWTHARAAKWAGYKNVH